MSVGQLRCVHDVENNNYAELRRDMKEKWAHKGFLRDRFTEPVWPTGHLQLSPFWVIPNIPFNGGGQNAKMAMEQDLWETLEAI